MPYHLEHDWFDQPVPANVEIGARSWIYSSYAFRHFASRRPCGVRIGSDSGVYISSFFDLGPCGQVEIGDYCALVGAIISTNSRITIGDYSFVAHDVVLADSSCAVPFGISATDIVAGEAASEPEVSISIGENCWIGARAILLRGAVIGDGAIVAAGAVVDFAVPPDSVVAGNPAAIVRR